LRDIRDTAAVTWRPRASLRTLRSRAEMMARFRTYFAQQGVLEVDTPSLSSAAVTDPQVENMRTRDHGLGPFDLYLHTSPEFSMKRLLAAGCGDIYQICKVFRKGEQGRFHNPEFTLLEWYRVGQDHHQLMDDVERLVAYALSGQGARVTARRLSYREAFRTYAGIDPFSAAIGELRGCILGHGLSLPRGLSDEDRDPWLDWLLTQRILPQLPGDRPTFIYDYPESQAALARIRPGEPAVAERFELFWGELELANGFNELRNAEQQARRFEAELLQRRALQAHEPPLDDRLIAALAAGLPQCAGVALGVDRLLMLAVGAENLSEVLAFPLDRA
jgi:lysyl-tRNA synthetase class 2